jgi:predicted transcriptional regulator
LILLAQHPEKRIRDIASEIGITERAVQRIIAELADAGYLEVDKIGRRNRYAVDGNKYLRHPVESHCTIADLMRMIKD